MGHRTYTKYDYYLGKPVNFEAANGIVGSSSPYDDPLDRPKLAKQAIGTSAERHTTFDYNDTARIITTTSDLEAVDDGKLVSKLLYDQMGRPTETQQFEGGTNYIAVQTQYDPLGRAYKISNPFRPWQSETAIWTTSAFDAMGRVTSVTTPDSATVNTYYSGSQVLVKDQMGKERISQTNGLGQLTDVWEITSADDSTESVSFPNHSEVTAGYRTKYAYDTLGNLITVTQPKGTAGTTQTRSFVYNSLSQLTDATNPESGHIVYDYDANGNLLHKTDARPVTATYEYDALNRNKTVDYSDTTGVNPDITRLYDGAANGKGRLWESYAGGSASVGSNVEHTKVTTYDALGRPLSQLQEFKTNGVWSSPYTTQRSYNRAGGVNSQTYPSGKTVAYTYDDAGRTSSFTGYLGDGTYHAYSTEIIYSPLGGMTKEKFGTDTALYNKLFYNSRGQLAEIREGTSYTGPNDSGAERGAIVNFYGTCWGMCGGQNSTSGMPENNGNLRRQEIYIPNGPMFAQTFDYDNLNRLQRVTEGSSWQQEYVYDRYSNRRIEQDVAKTYGAGINKQSFELETATNRLLATGDSALTGSNLPQRKMRYDGAGNLTNDNWSSYGSSTAGAITRTYDAENRMSSAYDSSGGISYYTYNADGQRVRRKTGSVETWQAYGMDGELLAEYAQNASYTTPQKEYGYRNGQLLITADAPTSTPVNLALNKTATQSSDPGWGGPASKAVDGNADGNFYNWSVAHTNNDAQAWWQVDLGSLQAVQSVEVWNRTDCCADRLTNFNVILLDSNQSAVATVNVPGQGGTPATVSISGTARYVKVQLVGTNYLALAEVKVWGMAVTNLALNKTATQSSDPGWGGPPGKAVDGNTDGNFFNWSVMHTSNDAQAWWQVDLGSMQAVQSVEVWNRTECCADRLTNFNVILLDANQTAVSTVNVPGQGGIPTTVSISGMARYVKVQLVGTNYLALAEVRVLGATSGSSNINWLVTDQLGTPRLIFDKTGSLDATKRHDYLPFGEEIFAGTGGRISAQGYAADGVRQKFTQKERDIETGLDFFEARYYASTQGRFTGPDPYNIILETQATAEMNEDKARAQFFNYLAHPQNWNRYAYVTNNPLKYIDPTGEQLWLTGSAEERRRELERIKDLVGKDAAKYLTTTEICTKDGTVTVVGYSSNAFTKSEPEVTVRIADIIDSRDVVEYRIAEGFTAKDGYHTTAYYGGAATVAKEDSLNGHAQIFVHPKGSDKAQRILGVPTMLAASRSDDGRPLDFYDDIVDFHEFGHAYANIIDKVGTKADYSKRARDFENVIRARRGLRNRRILE